MRRKIYQSWVTMVIMCLSLMAPFACKKVSAMTILDTDVTVASDGCTMLGVYGSYYSQAQDALNRINEIRKEACDAGNVPDPRNKSRMLTSDDYVPVKWSRDLESVARIRAMEAGLAYSFMGSGHNRLNGRSIFDVSYNGVSSRGEDLAYNWGTSMVSGINQWYAEKSDWVNQVSGKVTGHYTSMINPQFTYVGLGDFYTEEAAYPNTLAGEFCSSSQNLDQTMQTAQTDVMQKIEVKDSYITGYILEGLDTIYTDKTTTLTAKACLLNGSNAHKLWVIGNLKYYSSDTSVATVTDEGVVTGVKNGTTTITAKIDGSTLASTVIAVKCGHVKELVSETQPTCTATGIKVYSCEICGESIEQVVPKVAHVYVYGEADSAGNRTGVCSVCGDTIEIIPPTTYTLWWGTAAYGNFSSVFPSSRAVGSSVYCWIDGVDGDSKYRDMVIESTDESVISVPETVIANSSNNKLDILAPGISTLTIYPKYNASLKKQVVVRIGDSGSVDITSADVTLSQTYYEYSGTACTPLVTISYHDTKLTKGTDYKVTYENNTEAGTATVVITGNGIFTGTIRKDFTIVAEEHTEHAYGAWKVVTAASCNKKGEKRRYCTVCNAYETAVIDELPHTPATDPEVPATCTESGLTAGSHCSVCGIGLVAQNIVKPTGHNWDTNYTIDVPATETTTGAQSIHCRNCNATKDQREIPATGKKQGADDGLSVPGDENKDDGSGTQNGDATDDSDEDDEDDNVDNVNYPKVGDTFTIKGLKYKVVSSNPEDDEYEVSCIGTTSKNITKLNVPNYVSDDDFDYEVASVGKKAFSGCKKLKTVSLSDFVTTISDQAFYGCTSLKKITIPAKTKQIGAQAFAKCKQLSLVNIKSSLLTEKNVGKQVFSGINKKAVVKVPAKKKSVYKKWLKKKGLNGKNQTVH